MFPGPLKNAYGVAARWATPTYEEQASPGEQVVGRLPRRESQARLVWTDQLSLGQRTAHRIPPGDVLGSVR